jgi:hypothetical protein
LTAGSIDTLTTPSSPLFLLIVMSLIDANGVEADDTSLGIVNDDSTSGDDDNDDVLVTSILRLVPRFVVGEEVSFLLLLFDRVTWFPPPSTTDVDVDDDEDGRLISETSSSLQC